MKKLIAAFAFSVLILGVSTGSAHAQELRIPGMVHWLFHTQNFPKSQGGQVITQGGGLRGGILGKFSNNIQVMYPHVPPPGSVTYSGGDLGAPSGHGFRWFAVANSGPTDPGAWSSLPPGIVVALKHSKNQSSSGIMAFGQYDPYNGPTALDGWVRRSGGDLGAPSGVGYVWYESTDHGNTDWTLVDRLPSGTVVGLRHTQNLRGQLTQFVWQGDYACRSIQPGNPVTACDPTNPLVSPPPGFVRISGGDRGAPGGVGFVWYQKQ